LFTLIYSNYRALFGVHQVARQRKMQFNVTQEEYEIIKEYSEKKQLSMAEILRDYIKTLALASKK